MSEPVPQGRVFTYTRFEPPIEFIDCGRPRFFACPQMDFFGMENAPVAAFFEPACIYGRPGTVLQQKIRKRVHLRILPEELPRKGARNATVLVGEQAEKPTLVKQAQKFPRGAGIHPVAPAIDSPNFLVQNAVEACGLDRDVACNERYVQATEPRAYGLVVPVMRRKENAPIAHLPENRGSTFRKAEFQTALPVGVRCGIGGQPLERGKTEKQIARMARHIEYKTTIKRAGIYMRNSSRDMAQVRIDDTALPPRKAEQGACAPRKKCGCCSAEEVHCAYNIQSPGSSDFGTFTESIQKQREQQQSPNGHPQGGIVNKSVIISTETFVPPLILGPCVVIIGAEYKQVYIR